MDQFEVKVFIRLRPSVLDPAGEAIKSASSKLGVAGIKSLRIGKMIEVKIESNEEDIKEKIDLLCDQTFTVEDFRKLLSMDCDVASGWYSQPHGYTPVVEKLDDAYFAENGHYQFIKTDEMLKRKFSFKADYIGFGWVLVKQGVFEQMEYPWFAPKKIKVPQGYEMCSEDVAWCLDAKALGIDVYVDPQIHVGHEKTQII